MKTLPSGDTQELNYETSTLKLITTNSESYFLLVYYLTASLRALPALNAGALVAAIVIS